jgi:hypothetical protein
MELSCVEMNCIELAHDRIEGWDFVVQVLNLGICYQVFKFLYLFYFELS